MAAQCTHEKTKVISDIDDDTGDIRKTICADESCSFVLKEEVLVKRPDGKEFWRPRGVKAEAQPDHFEFTGKGGKTLPPEEKILSAQEMALLAVKTREETIGKQARALVRAILDECIARVLDGEHNYQITPGDMPSGEILALAIKELKAQGYRIKKTPVPGEGTWIEVKWPTTPTKKRKRTTTSPQEFKVGKDKEQITHQKGAAAHRKAALKARSNLPTPQ